MSDLLKLKYTDILDAKGKCKEHITIKEKKTGKTKAFPINDVAKKALNFYIEKTGETSFDGYIFTSRKGTNNPITRQRALQVINEAAQSVGIKNEIGTHTLRKTFGYHARMKGVPIELIQKLFNHSAPSVTMRYIIGITKEEIQKAYFNLNL